MKYKIGDKVHVREDLIIDIDYGKEKFVSHMTPFKGKEVTISYLDRCGYYRIKEDSTYRWTDEMFLPITKYKIGDKVIVKKDLEKGKLYGDYSVNEDMFSLRGKIVTICNIEYGFYMLKEDIHKWCWTDEMFSGKVSQDFIPEEFVSQNRLSEEENPSDIITVKTTKVKLLFL